MRFLLVGNFGVGNLGDEAIKDYFLKTFPEVSWQVVSASPAEGELPRLPGGIRSLLSGRWITTLRALRASDGMVFGGGSLFTDVESVRACFLWWWHAFVARLLGKSVFLAFQGIGPLRTGVGERCARFVVRYSSFISVRDDLSFRRVESWGLNRKVIQSFDPVFSLIQKEKYECRSQKILVIIPRKNSPQSFIERASSLGREGSVHILSLQPDDGREQDVCARIRNTIGPRAEVIPVLSLDALAREVVCASSVLSQRYHGALAAVALGVPVEVMPQENDDKLASLTPLIREGEPARVRLANDVQRGEEELRKALQMHCL